MCIYDNKVILDYSRPNTPTDNPFIESFDGSFRDECLNTSWFLSVENAYEKINGWIKGYNYFRPHSSLNEMRPAEFIKAYLEQQDERRKMLQAPLDENM